MGAELYGADVILLEILKGLDKSLFRPIVVLPNRGPLVSELERNNIDYEIIDYPILRRQYFNLKGIVQYASEFCRGLKQLKIIVRKYNVDIITSNTLAVLEGLPLSFMMKKKHVWYVHEIIKEPKVMSIFYRSIIKISRTKVVCVSNAVKENLSKNSNRLTVIHNGIEPICTKKSKNVKNDSSPIVIGMIGRINKIKGQGFLVKVIKELYRNYPNIKVMMVGGVFEGQEVLLEELKTMIIENNLENIIEIHNFTQDVELFYKKFDIFVLPSIKPDSFPTVVLEAMSVGLPIVANVTGGVSEMVEHEENGYLIYDISEEKMLKYLTKLVENPELREKFGNRSQQIFDRRFTNRIFKERINYYYENL